MESSAFMAKSEEKYSDFGLLFSDLPLKLLQFFSSIILVSLMRFFQFYDFTLKFSDNHYPLPFCYESDVPILRFLRFYDFVLGFFR